MAESIIRKSDLPKEVLELIASDKELQAFISELEANAPPLEILGKDEVEAIEKSGKILAAKAESYYLGYMQGTKVPVGEVADAGVTIVAAAAGSAVGTVVGQVVGKKMGSEINAKFLIDPEGFNRIILERRDMLIRRKM